MAEYKPTNVERYATACYEEGQYVAAEMLRAYAATLRQQAARVDVDDAMVMRAMVAWAEAPVRRDMGRSQMRAALTAALAQNTQGDAVAWQYRDVVEGVPSDWQQCTRGTYLYWATPENAARGVAEVRALYLHAERARVPAGWVLVPREPTEAMFKAGGKAGREYLESYGGNNPAVIYKAMLAAAPSQLKDAGEVGKLSFAELLGPPIPEWESAAMREVGAPGWDDDSDAQPDDSAPSQRAEVKGRRTDYVSGSVDAAGRFHPTRQEVK